MTYAKMQNTPVALKILLGKAQLSKNLCSHLQVGDTIILDQRIDEPLTILIEGKKRLAGYPGIFNHKKAIKITKI